MSSNVLYLKFRRQKNEGQPDTWQATLHKYDTTIHFRPSSESVLPISENFYWQCAFVNTISEEKTDTGTVRTVSVLLAKVVMKLDQLNCVFTQNSNGTGPQQWACTITQNGSIIKIVPLKKGRQPTGQQRSWLVMPRILLSAKPTQARKLHLIMAAELLKENVSARAQRRRIRNGQRAVSAPVQEQPVAATS